MPASEMQSPPAGPAVASDPALLADIRRHGRLDVTGCYQCGTCTLVCDLAEGPASFPRRVIRYALLGLRGPLLASLDPWICHDCGDCSVRCPRRAEPRLSLETLRRYLAAQYDWTGMASRIARSRAWYVGSLAFVAALVLGLVVFYHLVWEEMPLADFATEGMGLEHMLGSIFTSFVLAVVLVPLALLASNAARMWRFTMGGTGIPLRHYFFETPTYVGQSVSHEKMGKCPERVVRKRWPKHWAMAFGLCAKLAIVVFFLSWFQTDRVHPVYHPQRLAGYLIAGMVIYGAGQILVGRARKRTEFHKYSTLRDVMLPVLLVLTAASGLCAHVFRCAGLELATHYAYAAHLMIATPMLVIEIPFGKMSHMVYRPLALYFQAVKERAGAAVPTGKAVPQYAG